MEIASVLSKATSCSDEAASEWAEPLDAAMGKYHIDTPEMIAAFLVNVGFVSRGLTVFTGMMFNEAPTLLAEAQPHKYAVNEHQAKLRPNAVAHVDARNNVAMLAESAALRFTPGGKVMDLDKYVEVVDMLRGSMPPPAPAPEPVAVEPAPPGTPMNVPPPLPEVAADTPPAPEGAAESAPDPAAPPDDTGNGTVTKKSSRKS